MIKVVIVEYDINWRDYYVDVIDSAVGFQVFGSSSSVSGMHSFLRSGIVDVVLLDVDDPDYRDLEMTTEILEKFPEINLIALVDNLTLNLMANLIGIGYMGIIRKTNTTESEILKTIKIVGEEGLYVANCLDVNPL